MTKTSFNLIDEPWLAVKNVRGEIDTVSMRTLFHRAHEIRGLAGELPSQDFAVMRILLAVLYRVFDTEEHDDPEEDWRELWEANQLPTEPIDDYLDRWHHRFDLFDDDQPWFQVGSLRTVSGDTRPVDLLIPDCPNSDSLFSMRRGYTTISAAESARWLIHCQAYDVSGIKSGAVGDDRVKGGKGYPIGVGWAGWLGGITLVGDDLRQSLLLNLVFERNRSEDDLPVWELPPLTPAPRPNARGVGQVSLLSWPQRRVRLFPNEDGEVGRVIIANGDPIDYQYQHLHETMTGWRYSVRQTKKLGQDIYMARTFDPAVALWRGISSLLPTVVDTAGKPDSLPCASLVWSARLADLGILPKSRLLRIETVGIAYGPQMASWDEIFSDQLSFNIQLAETGDTAAKEIVYAAVGRAADAVRALGDLAGNLAVAAGGDASGPNESAKARGYGALDAPFRAWLAEFDPAGDLEAALAAWTRSVRLIARQLADEVLASAGPSAFVGRVVQRNNKSHLVNTGQADAWFHRSLNKALPYPLAEEGVSA